MDTLSVYIPISKVDPDKRMVYGYASTEALDSQGEVVTKDAIKAALPDYMKFANVREMHQASAVGKAVEVTVDDKGLYVGTKVVDDAAWNKVKEGVYNGYSIGGRSTKKVDGLVHGLQLTEISLVDRPANPETVFTMFKMEASDMNKSDDEVVVETPQTPEAVVAPEETKTEEVVPVEVETDKAEVVETPTEVATPDTTEEVVTEEVKEASDTDENLTKISTKIASAQMPTEDELAYMLKSQDQPVTADTIASLKDVVAGKVLENVAKAAQETFDKDAVIDAANKSGNKAEMAEIYKSLEVKLTELAKRQEEDRLSTTNTETKEVAKVGRAISQSNMDKVLSALNDVVQMVSSFNGGGGLSQEDQDAITNGVSAGSERTSETISTPKDPSNRPAQINLADTSTDLSKTQESETTDLAKVQGELTLVKEQLQKLLDAPQPIKAKVSYQTVEKVFTEGKTTTNEASELLTKIDANYEEMKNNPNDLGLQKIAADLSKAYSTLIHN